MADLVEGRLSGFQLRSLVKVIIGAPAWPALLLLLVAAGVFQPRLLTIPFLLIVLRQAAPLGIAALGQMFPMIGRSIDVSIGGVIAVVNVTLALPAVAASSAASVTLPVIFGAFVGLVNALFVAYIRASAVVVTLGMSVILVGVSYLISGGAPGGSVNPWVRDVATGRLGLIPYAGVLLVVIAVIASILLRKTAFGHALYATGSNFSAAWLGGLAVRKELVAAHVLCGVLAGAAGIVLTGYIGTGTLNLGADIVMASVAAVVIGGTTFGGGAGGVLGVVAGAYALTFLANLMTGMGLGKPAQLIVQGAIIAGAAALASRRER